MKAETKMFKTNFSLSLQFQPQDPRKPLKNIQNKHGVKTRD